MDASCPISEIVILLPYVDDLPTYFIFIPLISVMEVPDLTYLKESEFSAHFDNGENPPEKIPTLVVHYTPPDVFNNPT